MPIDVWMRIAVGIRGRQDQQPAGRQELNHLSNCTEVIRNMLEHADARNHFNPSSEVIPRIEDVDVQHCPVPVHHPSGPVVANVVDRRDDEPTVVQQVGPCCGPGPYIEDRFWAMLRQNIEGEAILDRPFVVNAKNLVLRFRRTDPADVQLACPMNESLQRVHESVLHWGAGRGRTSLTRQFFSRERYSPSPRICPTGVRQPPWRTHRSSDEQFGGLPATLFAWRYGALRMFASVTALLKPFSVRKSPKALPFGLRNPQRRASGLLAAKMLRQSIASLVQMDELIRRIGNRPGVALEEPTEQRRTRGTRRK
jgi:hypothetical protein